LIARWETRYGEAVTVEDRERPLSMDAIARPPARLSALLPDKASP
jgi:hypothetical protein